jgi:hypothetical protein
MREELVRNRDGLRDELDRAGNAYDAALRNRDSLTGRDRGEAHREVERLKSEISGLKDQLNDAERALRKFDLFQDVESNFDPTHVVGSAASPCAGATPDQSLAEISQRLNQGTDRDQVINAIRDVGPSEGEAHKFSGYLNAKDIEENRWAFDQARQILKNAQTDVVLGLERGGKALSETALYGMAEPPALETVKKANVKKPDNRVMIDQMKALVKAGKKHLSMIDVNMGGGSYRWMKKQAEALVQELKDEHLDEGVDVTIIMLSEQFGFPNNVQDGIQLDPNVKPGVTGVFIPVRFVGGDDVDRIAGDDSSGPPLGVFDDEGRAAPIPQDEEHGRTPREQFIKLMNPS